MGGDGEANYAYYAFHERNILPHDLAKMSDREKAMIFAMIQIRLDKEKQDRKKTKK